MRQIAAFALFTLCPIATAQVQLQYAPVSGNYVRYLSDKIFVGSRQSHIAISASSTNPQTILGGSGTDTPLDAKLDPAGNIWIVGNTTSDDFPLVNPLIAHKSLWSTAGFVMELDPSGSRILFSSYLAGQASTPFTSIFPATHATALAIDPTGNIYIGGDTDDPAFPITPGTLLPKGPMSASLGAVTFSYVVKLSPEIKLVYSSLIRTGFLQCVSPDCYDENFTNATISSLAVDSAGVVTVAGIEGGVHYGIGYIARLAANATQLLWSATLPYNVDSAGTATPLGAVTSLHLAQDVSGNVSLFGVYGLLDDDPLLYGPGAPGLFYAHFPSGAQQPDSLIDLGLSPDSAAAGLAIDSSGRVYLAGTSSAAKFPNAPAVPNLGADFVFSPGASPTFFRFPTGVVVAAPTLDAAGNIQLLGAQGSLLTIPPTYGFNTMAVVAFANAASHATGTGLYDETILSIYGFNLPLNPKVTIDGSPAQVYYASPNQINVLVKGNTYNGSMLSVSSSSQTVNVIAPPTQSIGIFTTDGTYAAALNQDCSVNSPANPAAAGSFVCLLGTGFPPTSHLAVTYMGTPLNLSFFAACPGYEPVTSIPVQTPASGGPLLVQAYSTGGQLLTANPVFVYVRQSSAARIAGGLK